VPRAGPIVLPDQLGGDRGTALHRGSSFAQSTARPRSTPGRWAMIRTLRGANVHEGRPIVRRAGRGGDPRRDPRSSAGRAGDQPRPATPRRPLLPGEGPRPRERPPVPPGGGARVARGGAGARTPGGRSDLHEALPPSLPNARAPDRRLPGEEPPR